MIASADAQQTSNTTAQGVFTEAQAARVKCGHPDCDKPICPIRQHANSEAWSIHVTGPRAEGHLRCSYGAAVQAQILALMLDIGQAEQAPRVQRAREEAKQMRLEADENGEFVIR